MKSIFIISLLLISACSSDPQPIKYKGETSNPRNRSVYVVNHGWHTGFAIPAEEAIIALPHLKKRFQQRKYFEFGWGDRGFYQAQEITIALVIQAVFWPTKSVMHVVSFSENPKSYFYSSEVRRLRISKQQLNSLLLFIKNSFKTSESGTWISLKKGIYGDSQFYQGVGDFYLMSTCNKWTAKGLKSMGMDISPLFKLTAGSIMQSLEEN